MLKKGGSGYSKTCSQKRAWPLYCDWSGGKKKSRKHKSIKHKSIKHKSIKKSTKKKALKKKH